MNIEIATYWNVETLYYVFNGVASIMGGAGFEGLLKMIFLFAIGVGIFAYAGNKQLEMAKWFIQALIFVTILNLPIARVILTDKTLLEPPRTVDNVPFAVAVVAQSANLVSGWLAGTYETVFSVPDDIGLQKGDLGFGHRILKNVNKATVRDPGMRADLMQFFKECTLRDIDDGAIDPVDIVSGTDTWNVIFSNTSPARFVTYDTLTGAPKTDTCKNVADILKDRVDAAVTAAQTFYGKQAYTRADNDALATSMFVSTVGTSYDWILSSSASASEALRQSMFNNIWRDAGTELPALLGDSARAAEVTAMTASAQAATQAGGANASISILAQETLPHMRNWIEAILYAMFPIVVVLVVLTTAEGAKKVLAGYMMSLAWIGMWPVLFAVINHLSLMHMRYKARTLDLAAGVPFQLSDVFDATLSDEQALIGYMVILVPFISGAVIKMSQGGLMSLADRMVAGFSSAVHGAGYQHSIGNHTMGHVGADNSTTNHTQMNKYNGDYGMTSGGASITAPNGDVWRYSPNGTFTVQQNRSNMIAARNIDQRFDSNLSDEAHKTYIAGTGDSLAYDDGTRATRSSTTGLTKERGNYQREGETATDGVSGTYSTNSTDGEGIRTDRRHSATWDESSAGEDRLNLGVRTPWGGGGRGGAPAGGANPADEKRLVDGMRQGGASQAEIDQALQNYRSQAGGGRGRGGMRIPFSGGADVSKVYGARHANQDQYAQQHDDYERVDRSWRADETGGHQDERAAGEDARQSSRRTDDATLTDDFGRRYARDAINRDEDGVGSKSNRGESRSYTSHYDAYADPSVMEAVASRHGMSAPRFYSLPAAQRERMMDEYISEMEAVQAAKQLRTTTFSGDTLPESPTDLADRTLKDRRELDDWADDWKGSVRDDYIRKAADTGAGSTAPLHVDTSVPSLVYQARSKADTDLESIKDRTKQFDAAVDHNTSPDRPVGGGRRSELGAAHKIAVNDAADAAETAVTKTKNALDSAASTVKRWFSDDKK